MEKGEGRGWEGCEGRGGREGGEREGERDGGREGEREIHVGLPLFLSDCFQMCPMS